jgi:hypothetical protein
MDDRKQEYLALLKRKLAALLRMLELTNQLEITGEGEEEQLEKEAECFAALYDNRANIVNKIKKLDESLAQYKDIENDKSLAKARQLIFDKMKETVKTLVELDKKNVETARRLTDFLKGNIKKVRGERNINDIYVDTNPSTSGYYFDRTN